MNGSPAPGLQPPGLREGMRWEHWGKHRGTALILTLTGVPMASLGRLPGRRAAGRRLLTPLILFRSAAFSISAAQILKATMVLFTAMPAIPSFLHEPALTVGLYVIPLLAGLAAATAVAGPVIAGPDATRSARSSAPSSPATPSAGCVWPARAAVPRPSSSR